MEGFCIKKNHLYSLLLYQKLGLGAVVDDQFSNRGQGAKYTTKEKENFNYIMK